MSKGLSSKIHSTWWSILYLSHFRFADMHVDVTLDALSVAFWLRVTIPHQHRLHNLFHISYLWAGNEWDWLISSRDYSRENKCKVLYCQIAPQIAKAYIGVAFDYGLSFRSWIKPLSRALKGKSTNRSDHGQEVLQLMCHRPFCERKHPSLNIVWNIAHSMRQSMLINSQNIKENHQKSAFTLPP